MITLTAKVYICHIQSCSSIVRVVVSNKLCLIINGQNMVKGNIHFYNNPILFQLGCFYPQGFFFRVVTFRHIHSHFDSYFFKCMSHLYVYKVFIILYTVCP